METTTVYYGKIRQRWHASIIDGLILVVPSLIIYLTLPYSIISDVIDTLVIIGYNVYFISKNGQTPGKRYAGVKVVVDNEKLILPSLGQAILRESVSIGAVILLILFRLPIMGGNTETSSLSLAVSLKIVLFLFNIGNVISILATSKRKALHDYLASTVVVDSRKMEREERKREHRERLLQFLRND